MPLVELDEQSFKTARQKAVDAGFSSVAEYIADFIVHDQVGDFFGQTPDLDHLFTPARLAHIDYAMAEIRAGKSYSADQAAQELAKRRDEWIRNNPA